MTETVAIATLFPQIDIRGKRFRNRMAFAPHGTGYTREGGIDPTSLPLCVEAGAMVAGGIVMPARIPRSIERTRKALPSIELSRAAWLADADAGVASGAGDAHSLVARKNRDAGKRGALKPCSRPLSNTDTQPLPLGSAA